MISAWLAGESQKSGDNDDDDAGGLGRQKPWRRTELAALHKARDMAPDFATFLELASALLPRRSRSEIVGMLRSRQFATTHAALRARAAERARLQNARAPVLAPAVAVAREEARAARAAGPGRPRKRGMALAPAAALAAAPSSLLRADVWLKSQLQTLASAEQLSADDRAFVARRLSIRAQIDAVVFKREPTGGAQCLALATPAEITLARARSARHAALARTRARASSAFS